MYIINVLCFNPIQPGGELEPPPILFALTRKPFEIGAYDLLTFPKCYLRYIDKKFGHPHGFRVRATPSHPTVHIFLQKKIFGPILQNFSEYF